MALSRRRSSFKVFDLSQQPNKSTRRTLARMRTQQGANKARISLSSHMNRIRQLRAEDLVRRGLGPAEPAELPQDAVESTPVVVQGQPRSSKQRERWHEAAIMLQRNWRGKAFRDLVALMLQQIRRDTLRKLIGNGDPVLIIVVEGSVLVPTHRVEGGARMGFNQSVGYVVIDLRMLTIDQEVCEWFTVHSWTNKDAIRGSLLVELQLTSRLHTSVVNRQKLLVRIRDARRIKVTLQDRAVVRRAPWWGADIVCTMILDGEQRKCNIGRAGLGERDPATAKADKLRREDRVSEWDGNRNILFSFGRKSGVVESMVVKKWGEHAQSRASADVKRLTDGIDRNRKSMFTVGLDVEYYLAVAKSMQTPARPRKSPVRPRQRPQICDIASGSSRQGGVVSALSTCSTAPPPEGSDTLRTEDDTPISVRRTLENTQPMTPSPM